MVNIAISSKNNENEHFWQIGRNRFQGASEYGLVSRVYTMSETRYSFFRWSNGRQPCAKKPIIWIDRYEASVRWMYGLGSLRFSKQNYRTLNLTKFCWTGSIHFLNLKVLFSIYSVYWDCVCVDFCVDFCRVFTEFYVVTQLGTNSLAAP